MKIIDIKFRGTPLMDFDLLKTFQGGLKTLSEESKQKLKNSLIKYGFIQPIFIWKNNILDGHQRLIVLEELFNEGYALSSGENQIPIIRIKAKSKKQAKELILVYNSQYGKITEKGLNEFLIDSELDLDNLDTIDLDLSILNIEQEEKELRDIEPDNINKIETKIKRGELYKLGEHRLMCGDATNKEDIYRLIEGNKIDMVFTDPPYGINLNGDNSKRRGLKLKSFKDDTTQYAIDSYNIIQELNIPKQVWWGANYYCHSLPETNNWLVWDKRVEEKMVNANSDCELAFVKDGHSSIRIFRHLWKGLIKASEHGQKRVHPTQKPIELSSWCFNKYDSEGLSVLDLFGGSGTTLIACEQMDRVCYMMEIEPLYCQVIINRWEKLTGKKAELIK